MHDLKDSKPAKAKNSGHAPLEEYKTVCTRTYSLSDNTPHLTVTTTLLTNGLKKVTPRRYHILVKRLTPPTNVGPYSLCNMGIQAVRWHVALLSVKGKQVTLQREHKTKPTMGPFNDTTNPVEVNQRLRRICPHG